MTTKVVVIVCLVLGALPKASFAQQTVSLLGDQSQYSLGPYLEYLVEEGGPWSIEQVRTASLSRKFKRSGSEVPNFGFTSTPHWFRVQIHSRLEHKQKYLLEIPFAVLDRIDLFIQRDDGTFAKTTVGDSFPHGNKVIRHHYFVFPLEINPGQSKKIYFRIETSGVLQAPLELWTPEAFLDHQSETRLFFGVLCGFLLVMAAYNLFIFFVIRERSYLYLVLFLSSGFVVITTHLGLAQQYLWPSWPWLANRALPLGLFAFGLSVTLFTRDFLDVTRNLPAWRKPFAFFVISGYIGLALVFVLPYNVSIILVTILGLGLMPLLLGAAAVTWRRGLKLARYYLLAWATLLLMGLVTTMNKLAIVPRTTWTENAYMIGSALGIVLFSLALADRINILRGEKDQAQARALDLQLQAAENLEQQVKARTQELEQAYERLAEHDRLKSRFFSNVSHEVRTPLTLIFTPLERLLEDDGLDGEVRQQLTTMRGNTQRLLRLVNQLLDFSRLESGVATVSFECVEIRPLVEAVVKGFEPFAQSKGLELVLAGGADLPEIYSDPVKLDKVLSNLLSNACKFTDAGGSVTVQLIRRQETLAIAVRDTGIGIAEEDLPKVFTRFHQVDASPSRRYGGTGIGLALSKELVALIGGKLEVSSTLGAGSVFTVSLPLGKAHIVDPALIRGPSDRSDATIAASAEAAAALAAEAGTGGQPDTALERPPDTGEETRLEIPVKGKQDARPQVLVVEDNPDMRRLVAEICHREFRVLEAEDGEQGLAMTKEHRPALVISDIMMPKVDGHELLRRLRVDPTTASIPVILLTARAGPQMRLEGLESGATDYLAKPFESRELLARTRNLVQLQAQEQRLRELNARLQQEVIKQTTEAERARMLGRYLSPVVVRSILEGNQPVQVGQQRRSITAFRLELRGFDRVAEVVEPRDMAAMLNGYLWAMSEVAFNRGATVDAFVQDTVRGFFGAPVSKSPEQDALRCARMAVEMWQRAVETCQRWEGHLMERVPEPTMILTSGEAIVGNFGSSSRLEYTAVGGPVHEASTVLPHVKRGMLVCGQSTWELIAKEMKGLRQVSVALPDRSGPVKLYRLAALDEFEPMPSPVPSFVETAHGVEGMPPIPAADPTAVTREVARLERDTVIAKRYVVVRLLGSGGSGAVYQVKDRRMGVDAALKLVWHHLQADSKSRERLYREVRLAWLVSHPNVARIYDLGEWEGLEFISMEYIDGQSLSVRLRSQGPLPVDEGKQVLRQICAGLAAAHMAGIVHRDLKPANIMLERGGRVVILDFGIARWVEHADGDGEEAPGTPSYMAPEQFSGGDVDFRTDIYALGVVAYEMFTGRKPFEAEDIAGLALKHMKELPRDPQSLRPELPPRMAAVILGCLEKAPEDRFAAVEEIIPLIS